MKNVFVICANRHKPLQSARPCSWSTRDLGAPSAVPAFRVAFATGVSFGALVCKGEVGADWSLVVLARSVRAVEARSVSAAVRPNSAIQLRINKSRGCACSCRLGCGRGFARLVPVGAFHRCWEKSRASARGDFIRAGRSARPFRASAAFPLIAKHCIVEFCCGCGRGCCGRSDAADKPIRAVGSASQKVPADRLA